MLNGGNKKKVKFKRLHLFALVCCVTFILVNITSLIIIAVNLKKQENVDKTTTAKLEVNNKGSFSTGMLIIDSYTSIAITSCKDLHYFSQIKLL